MPPRPAVEIPNVSPGNVDILGAMKPAPGLGTVERMMRVRIGRPEAERLLLVASVQKSKGAVGDPGRGMPKFGELREPGLRRLGRGPEVLRPKRPRFALAAVVPEPALEMVTARRFLAGKKFVPMAEDHQLHVVEAHIRPGPVLRKTGRFFPALGRAVWRRIRVFAEMTLADEFADITGIRQASCPTPLCGARIQIDEIVVGAVGERQHPREDRRTRRLADEVGRDRRGEPGSRLGHPVEPGRSDPPPLEPETVPAVLVRGDEQYVRWWRQSIALHLVSGG